MSLQPQPWPDVPALTAAVARAASPKGTLAMRLRDEVGQVFADAEFAAAFAVRGAPGYSPAQLALISILQKAESLSDRQAADQVRLRIDWKYALGLELTDEGFDFSVLSGFRDRLLAHGLEEKVLDLLLARCVEHGLLREGGRARTDSTHVIAAVRSLNRLEFVGETVRAALEALAAAEPGWLAGVLRPGWEQRYVARVEAYRLPASAAGRAEMAVTIGRDGFALLAAVADADAPGWLREVPAVDVLRRTWVQQYLRAENPAAEGGMEVAWRENDDLPPGRLRFASPYDLDARYGIKRGSGWVGYKIHLTETCDDGLPRLITNVETSDATVTDQEMTPVVHAHLADRHLRPVEHAVDAGYTSTELFLAAATDGIELVGPLGANTSWQARTPDAFDLSDFAIDWDHQQVTCPNGAVSGSWRTEKARGKPVWKVDFRRTDCTACPLRARCTSSATSARKLTLRFREQHELLERLRVEQATDAWKKRYDIRAGVESTMRQATATTGVRHARYRGLDKNHLSHVFAAAAINLIRVDAHLTGSPPGPTRTTHFGRLVGALAI